VIITHMQKLTTKLDELINTRKQVADTLAMLHAPGFENNGGPANIAEEVRILLDNNNTYAREAARANDENKRLRSEIGSVKVELSRIFGEVRPHHGLTWFGAMLARIGETLANLQNTIDGQEPNCELVDALWRQAMREQWSYARYCSEYAKL